MEAVYEQQPMPTNITGVPVTIYVYGQQRQLPNNRTTTTDANGFYSLTWTPDITGNYTVYATFAGTEHTPDRPQTHLLRQLTAATAAPTATPLTGLASNTTLMYGS